MGAIKKPSFSQRMVDAIEAVLEGRITKDIQQMTILGRSLTHHSLDELMVLRRKFKAEALVEEMKTKGMGNVTLTKVRL